MVKHAPRSVYADPEGPPAYWQQLVTTATPLLAALIVHDYQDSPDKRELLAYEAVLLAEALLDEVSVRVYGE